MLEQTFFLTLAIPNERGTVHIRQTFTQYLHKHPYAPFLMKKVNAFSPTKNRHREQHFHFQIPKALTHLPSFLCLRKSARRQQLQRRKKEKKKEFDRLRYRNSLSLFLAPIVLQTNCKGRRRKEGKEYKRDLHGGERGEGLIYGPVKLPSASQGPNIAHTRERERAKEVWSFISLRMGQGVGGRNYSIYTCILGVSTGCLPQRYWRKERKRQDASATGPMHKNATTGLKFRRVIFQVFQL